MTPVSFDYIFKIRESFVILFSNRRLFITVNAKMICFRRKCIIIFSLSVALNRGKILFAQHLYTKMKLNVMPTKLSQLTISILFTSECVVMTVKTNGTIE